MCVRVDERDIAVSTQKNAGPLSGDWRVVLVAGARYWITVAALPLTSPRTCRKYMN